MPRKPTVGSKRILSLGAGVQSTTLALMCLDGTLPPLDAAIFADTGWEPRPVYAHLWWLATRFAEADVPLYVVSAGDIRADALNPTRRFASMPLFVRSTHREGRLRRQCTKEYKIEPIRSLTWAIKRRHRLRTIYQLIGISYDEAHRMRDSDVRYITHLYPLVDLRMTRADCLDWLHARSYPTPPKSACVGCPYRDDTMWAWLRDTSPTDFADAVDFDARIRHGHVREGIHPTQNEAFLHRSLLPLDQVPLADAPADLSDPFGDECEGMCGV